MPPNVTAADAVSQTLFSTVNHNLSVIIYVGAAGLMIVLLIVRPNRKLILFLLGFILLAFNFQYVKHIVDPLAEQTRVAIESTGYQSAKSRRLMNIVFEDLIPLVTFIGGWTCLVMGMIIDHIRDIVSKHKDINATKN